MKAILVDDEPRALELIERYLAHFPQIKILATFRNGIKALTFLKDNQVDLIFLDINMPHLSGLALSRLTDEHVKIIFITAYAEYAPESYEVEAVDYLMKPVSFERFTSAINKVLKIKQNASKPSTEEEWINLKSNGRYYRIIIRDIYYLEKTANYMMYNLTKGKLLVRHTVAEALKNLPLYFLQVHKSFIVNSKLIEYYNKEEISVNGIIIPVGDMYRDRFLQFMHNTKL